MQDDQLDTFIQNAARSYNEPPTPDIDGMWKAIEQQHFDRITPDIASPRLSWHKAPWLRVAAALIVGVGLGRVSQAPIAATVAPSVTTASVPAMNTPDVLPALNAPDANKYLGETVALLASLQTDSRSARSDKALVSDAAGLLNTTRFLLDSPTTDPKVRSLLEDLELVLAQVVQMPRNGSTADVELIHQAMEQRDVMPRLRTAVANNYSAE